MAARRVQVLFGGTASQTPLPGLASGRSTLVFTVNTAACAYAAVTNQKKMPRHLRVQGFRSLPIDVLLVCLFCLLPRTAEQKITVGGLYCCREPLSTGLWKAVRMVEPRLSTRLRRWLFWKTL